MQIGSRHFQRAITIAAIISNIEGVIRPKHAMGHLLIYILYKCNITNHSFTSNSVLSIN